MRIGEKRIALGRNTRIKGSKSPVSSSIIPPSIRSVGCQRQSPVSISLLNADSSFCAFGGQFLPIMRYSTAIDREIVSLVNLFLKSSDRKFEVTTKPGDCPFMDIYFRNGSLVLKRIVNEQYTEVFVRGDSYKVNDGTPNVSMNALVALGTNNEIEYEAIAEPKKITIQRIKMRAHPSRGNLSIFEGYLSAKGINARMMDILFNFFGKQPKEQFNDGLNALPFEIKDGGPEAGYLTLIKEGKDEIIEVKVRPCYHSVIEMETDDDDYIYFEETDDDMYEVYDWNDEVDEKDERCAADEIGERYVDEVKNALKLLVVDYEKGAEDNKIDLGDIKFFYVLVNIRFGVDYKECLKFFLVAYSDKIHIRSMSRSAEGSTKHLEEYEELFKERVMKPDRLKLNTSQNMNFLLGCCDFGRKDTK